MAPRRAPGSTSSNALPSTAEELAQLIAQHVNAALAQRDATHTANQNANLGMQIPLCKALV